MRIIDRYADNREETYHELSIGASSLEHEISILNKMAASALKKEIPFSEDQNIIQQSKRIDTIINQCYLLWKRKNNI